MRKFSREFRLVPAKLGAARISLKIRIYSCCNAHEIQIRQSVDITLLSSPTIKKLPKLPFQFFLSEYQILSKRRISEESHQIQKECLETFSHPNRILPFKPE